MFFYCAARYREYLRQWSESQKLTRVGDRAFLDEEYNQMAMRNPTKKYQSGYPHIVFEELHAYFREKCLFVSVGVESFFTVLSYQKVDTSYSHQRAYRHQENTSQKQYFLSQSIQQYQHVEG